MKEHQISWVFVTMAAVVVVLAGIKAAAVIVEPFLLSIFIAIIFAPFFGWLNAKGLPSGLSLSIVVVSLLFVITLVGMLIGSSVQDFNTNLPTYESRLNEQFAALSTMLEGYGLSLPNQELGTMFDAQRIMHFAAGGLKSLGSILTNGFVILLTVVFMLLESTQLAEKIDEADGEKDTIKHLDVIIDKIKHYMVLKTLVSMMTGALIWLMLMLFGVDYAVLWGVLAFFLNYIPNIGSLLSAVPAVLLAIVQLGFLSAIEITVGYIIINTIVGSVIEPKIMGKGLGLSTLVVFLSLIFWGWLLGPVGMLLSIPLTIMAKIAFDAQPNTRWIAIMLGEGKP
jgi:AI-2 transport protein TqsA